MSEIPSLKAAKRIRAARIAELDCGSEDDQGLALVLSNCRKGERCHSTQCAVCGRIRMKKLRRAGRRMESNCSFGFTMYVPIDQITINTKGRRRIDERLLKVIAASMGEVGQLVPITLWVAREMNFLVSGLHRLEAAKLLGWKHVYADVIVETREQARKHQLYENLARADLRVLDKAEYVVELRGLLIAEAKVAQVEQPGGTQPAEKYVSKTAKRLGLSKDTVRRFVLIASLTASAKEAARDLLLDDNQSVLLLAAHEADEIEQVRVLKDAARRAAVRRGLTNAPGKEPVPKYLTKLAAQNASDEDEIAHLTKKLKRLTDLHAQRATALAIHSEVSEPADAPVKDVEVEARPVGASARGAADVYAELTARWDGLMGDIWAFVDARCRDDFAAYILSAPFTLPEEQEDDAVTTEFSDVYRAILPGVKTHNFELLRDGRGYRELE